MKSDVQQSSEHWPLGDALLGYTAVPPKSLLTKAQGLAEVGVTVMPVAGNVGVGSIWLLLLDLRLGQRGRAKSLSKMKLRNSPFQ